MTDRVEIIRRTEQHRKYSDAESVVTLDGSDQEGLTVVGNNDLVQMLEHAS